jgi:hypothetical protein
VPDNQDCNDSDATINPNATEVYYDGIDQDCDSESDFDQDKDGFDSIDFGGLDINDLDETCAESCRDGSTSEYAGVTCGTILEDFSASVNGSYYIDPNNDGDTADAISVFCDMSGGGWTYESSGQPFTLSFTGGVQELDTVGTEAEYLFTLYGAQGGDGQNNTGGLGGMAAASKTFSASTTLFVYIGGKGSDGGAADSGGCSTRTGGFNGGGRGSQGGSGGGGATDIRALDTLSDRILVAAGGGGCGGQNCYGSGGDGGGLTGSTGQHVGSGLTDFLGGEGGTQNSGGTSPNSGSADGTFGSGGDNVQCNDEAGGGGGWYGGAAGGNSNTTGGGGSSYYDGMDADQDTSTGAQSGNGHVEYIFR